MSQSSISDTNAFVLPDEDRGRPRKRRHMVKDEPDSNSSHSESPSSTQSVRVHGRQRLADENNHTGKEIEKPKSKYKIHIPKNHEFPSDTFFTQPPVRSSSPYRIDQFHWRKPQNPRAGAAPDLTSYGNHQSPTSNANEPNKAIEKTPLGSPLYHGDKPLVPELDEFGSDEGYEEILADLPANALAFSESFYQSNCNEPVLVSSQLDRSHALEGSRLAAPLTNLKQTTLFGTQSEVHPTQSQSNRRRNWPMANRDEPPTHHEINRDAMKTWVYPTNLGTIRDYQYSIVATGLYHNLLVALPTGLGKTFIAAAIMLNWYRWTNSAQIVFVAPTKPLVSQQVKACFGIAGIPRSDTTMLTGTTAPGLRAEEWRSKRVFFMTPQTLINDLQSGICDCKRLVLIVIDEAHRATGSYAYVEVVNFIKRFNDSLRVLALTATPGASVESVQEVIKGLNISRIEIRTEESLDIRQYIHKRKIETVLFDHSEEMDMVLGLFCKALQPAVDKLTGVNAYWSRDPLTLTPYGCTQARQRWFSSDAGRKANQGLKAIVMNTLSLLASLSHATELLKYHGIGPFFHKVLSFRKELHAGGKKGGKLANEINSSEPFQTMMSRVQIWINTSDFVGHPKLQYVQSVVLNHFLDAGEGHGASDPASTRIMIFAHYRHSAEEIVRVLRRNSPMIRPHVFVGQSSIKDSEGMDQKAQLDIIKKFQTGIYNTLVATSIGEEGLDIGEVDMIICYDASASPIRMLQRMGRTGRKRAGNIVVTLMKGKEENNFTKAKDNYEKMQVEIACGTRFTFYDEKARRIIPKDIQPIVDKRVIDIPIENTQADLPEPTKRCRPPKRPPKKFHMPDGVRTGFVNASHLHEDSDDINVVAPARKRLGEKIVQPPSPVTIPSLQEVLLTSKEERAFELQYLDIKGETPEMVRVPRLDTFPSLQRTLRPTSSLGHSKMSMRSVRIVNAMHSMSTERCAQYEGWLAQGDKEDGTLQAEKRARFLATCSRQLTSRIEHPSVSALGSNFSKTDADDSASTFPPSQADLDVRSSNIRDVVVEGLRETFENMVDGQGFVESSLPIAVDAQQRPSMLEQSFSVQASPSEDELPDFDAVVRRPMDGDSGACARKRRVMNLVAEDSDDS